MMSKFVLLALVAVSVAQDLAPNPDYEIRKGLLRLKGFSTGAERGVDSALREVDYKRAGLKVKATVFLEKELRVEEQLQENVERVGRELEKRAQELSKPPSVFECITRAEKLTSSRLEAVSPRFEVDIRRLEKTKLDSIDTASKPLQGIKDGLEARYEKYVTEVKNCRDPVSVRKAVEKARREYELLNYEFRRITSQVLTAYSQFARDASNQFGNTSRLLNRIATEGIRSIKACVFRRSFTDLFEIESAEEIEEIEEY